MRIIPWMIGQWLVAIGQFIPPWIGLRMELSLCRAGAIIRTDRWVRRAADGRTNRDD